MNRHPRVGLVISAALTVLALGQSPARAAFITTVTGTATPQGNGQFLYSYTVANDPTSTVGVSEFDVNVSDSANLQSLKSPTGFLAVYTPGFPGDTIVQFLSTDPSTDIAAGKSGVFSFTTPVSPALAPVVARGIDGSGSVVQNAPTSALSPVPEPSAFVLFGLGVAAAPILASRRRRAAAAG